MAYLAAPSGKFITGEVLTVDGGQQLWGDPWAAGRPRNFELDYAKARLPREERADAARQVKDPNTSGQDDQR